MRRFVFLTMVALVMAVVLASPAWAATFTVDRSDDPDLSTTPTADDCTDAANDCSLRGAINAANSSSGVADTINFNLVSPATITLGSQLPTITDSAGLTIDGGSANITVSGNNAVRVFEVGTSTISGAKLTLNNLTVANGRADNAGGGILNLGTLEVNSSTISGNRAGTYNGGIGNASAGTLTVNNSTISGNSANNNGGGIGNGSTATLNNTIVANNEGGNCAGLPVTDDGGNLEWPGNDCGFALSADPLLGPLADNGGPTQTHALQPDSPAIDAAVECPPPATDQRGVSRPQGAACDIGAFEFVPPPDTEAPKTTIALDPTEPNGQNGWYTSAVGVKVSASDGTGGGSGVAETRCVLDPQSVPTSFADLPSSRCPYLESGANVSADGLHTLYAASIDEEGNKEPIVSKGF